MLKCDVFVLIFVLIDDPQNVTPSLNVCTDISIRILIKMLSDTKSQCGFANI